jgi:hypothetical protein
VQRYAIEVNAGAAGHEGMLAREYIEPGPFNYAEFEAMYYRSKEAQEESQTENA